MCREPLKDIFTNPCIYQQFESAQINVSTFLMDKFGMILTIEIPLHWEQFSYQATLLEPEISF